MTENEPLNDYIPTNGRIVSSESRNGNVPTESVNGLKPTLQVNGISHSPAEGSWKRAFSSADGEEHIRVPSCRDIHGMEPPDGGIRAWLVMVSAFICNGVIFGFINTYGVIHLLLTDRLTAQGDKDASSKAALVGSLAIGTTFLLSPVAGCLTDKIGLRLTTLLGGLLSAGGLLFSSFCTNNIVALYFTYGVMFGLGSALAYTPTLAILGHYFKRYLGKVSGFVTAGSSVFTVILPPALNSLIKAYGLETTLQVMSLTASFVIVCSFVYKPLHPPRDKPIKKPGRSRIGLMMRSIINVDIWKSKKYVIWALCVPLALFGYFVPYVHMMKFVETVFPGKSTNLPVMCIGITSGLGRITFGIIADIPGVNRIILQQISLICIGVVTLLLPLTSSYVLLVVFTLIMGLFDGCFITLFGPIAYEICGPSGATQAIGFVLGLSSLPLTIGPPVAGRLYDTTGSYTLPFILAGLPPLVGASVMCLTRCVREDPAVKSKDPYEGENMQSQGEKHIRNEYEESKTFMNGNGLTHETAFSNATKTTLPQNSIGGKATLADAGIKSCSTSYGLCNTALVKLNDITAYASNNSSSAFCLANSTGCPQTALLSDRTNTISTLVLDENISNSGACRYSKSNLISQNTNEHKSAKRRYMYSVL